MIGSILIYNVKDASISYRFLVIDNKDYIYDHGITVIELSDHRPVVYLSKKAMFGDKWNVYVDGELYEGY